MNEKNGFYNLGIAPNILGILDKLNFTVPTPIQEKSIPAALDGKDLIGVAQTGTGKTMAFGIPMVQAALAGKNGLVVLPTRELALQVQEAFHKIGDPLDVRSIVLIGGAPMGNQIREIRRGADIVIGTPGRIIDHLEQKTISLSSVSVLVLDEADRMLDMGFAPQLKKILSVVPKERQTMLFSATMPEDIVTIARTHMKLPVRVEIAPQGTTASKVTQEVFFLQKFDKPRLLEKLLGEYRGSVLVFSRTKHGARKLALQVRAMGHTAAELHSDRSLGQRREALEGFRNGKYRVLVATDIAARGIDVKGIELVLNYDLPDSLADYVHRIGRTGRAGGVGHAISFATPDQRADVKGIERLIRVNLPTPKLPELPPARAVAPSVSYRPDSSHRFQGRNSPPRGGGQRHPGGGGSHRPSRPFSQKKRFGPSHGPSSHSSGGWRR